MSVQGFLRNKPVKRGSLLQPVVICRRSVFADGRHTLKVVESRPARVLSSTIHQAPAILRVKRVFLSTPRVPRVVFQLKMIHKFFFFSCILERSARRSRTAHMKSSSKDQFLQKQCNYTPANAFCKPARQTFQTSVSAQCSRSRAKMVTWSGTKTPLSTPAVLFLTYSSIHMPPRCVHNNRVGGTVEVGSRGRTEHGRV